MNGMTAQPNPAHPTAPSPKDSRLPACLLRVRTALPRRAGRATTRHGVGRGGGSLQIVVGLVAGAPAQARAADLVELFGEGSQVGLVVGDGSVIALSDLMLAFWNCAPQQHGCRIAVMTANTSAGKAALITGGVCMVFLLAGCQESPAMSAPPMKSSVQGHRAQSEETARGALEKYLAASKANDCPAAAKYTVDDDKDWLCGHTIQQATLVLVWQGCDARCDASELLRQFQG